MRNKLTLLIGESLKQKVKTKVFVVSQLIMLIFIVFITNIATVIRMMDDDNSSVVRKKVYIVDETYKAFDLFAEEMEKQNTDTTGYEVIPADSVEEAIVDIQKNNGWVVHIVLSEENFIEFNLYTTVTLNSYDSNIIGDVADNVKMSLKLESLEISTEDSQQLLENAMIHKNIVEVSSKDSATDRGIDLLLNFVLIYVFVPCIVLIAMAMATIGADINDEKATRAMDFIMANVKASTHLTAKVITGYIFAFIQIAFVMLDLTVARLVANALNPAPNYAMVYINNTMNTILTSSASDLLVYLIPILLIFIVLNCIACAVIAGVFASMSTTNGEYQQIQLPMVMFLFSNLIISMIVMSFENTTLMKIMSFLPFLSVNLSPGLFILGEIGIVEVIVSLVIMILTTCFLIKYGFRIYRIGVLDYTNKNLWRKVFRAVIKK